MKTKLIMMAVAAAVLLGACKGSGISAVADSARVINNDDRALNKALDTGKLAPKLVKTGDIKLKVKNVQQSSEAIAGLTVSYKGMVMHHDMTANIERSKDVQAAGDSVKHISVFNTVAEMTLKIPSDRLEDFMNQVNHMGLYVNERKMDITDLSNDYQRTQLKLQSRRQIISQQQTGRIVIKNPANVLQLKDDIIDGQMNNQLIDDAVKYSMISLSLYQSNTVITETIVNDDLNTYDQPVLTRIGFALANGWDMFTQLVIAIANLWVFILLGLAGWAGYRLYKRKKVTVALVTP